jgi:RimJ/RimL family protein N-acetyltransferase
MTTEIKLAKANDSRYVFILRKKNYNQKSFIKKNQVSFINHNIWFKKAIKDYLHNIYIISFKKRKCGYARLEKVKKNYEVSILIDKKFRQKGIASRALILIEKTLKFNSEVIAKVNKNNLESIGMFSNLGYKVTSTNSKTYVMKKKLNKIKIIDQIEKIRRRNNASWMDILRLAYKKSPKECGLLMSEIYKDDTRISKLVKKMIR